MARGPRKCGDKVSKRGLSDEQIPVLICRGRPGRYHDFVLEKGDKIHIGAALSPYWQAMLYSAPTAAGHQAPPFGRWTLPIVRSIWPQAFGFAKVYHIQNVNAIVGIKEWMPDFTVSLCIDCQPSRRRLIDRTHEPLSPHAAMFAALE